MIEITDFLWVNVAFAILVLVFDFGLSANKRFKLNRAILILIPFLSFSVLLSFGIEILGTIGPVSQVLLPIYEVSDTASSETAFSLVGVYLSISMVLVLKSFVQNLRLYLRGEKRNMAGTNYLVFSVKENGNYSFLNRIFLLEDDIDNQTILRHEEIHLNQNHSIDLLFTEIVLAFFWINPFVWRWKILVKQNHEYLVDEELMKGNAGQAREYVHLLLDRALNTNQFSLGNYFSLNSLISKRIIMLNKTKKQKAWKTISMSFLMVGAILCMGACDKNNPNNNVIENQQVKPQDLSNDGKSDSTYSIVEEMPQFKGGDEALISYLRENIKYPAECKKIGEEGIVYVTFVINKNGKVEAVEALKGKREIHELLTKEATRVISSMPNWTPGKNNGEVVRVRYNIPINFKLSKEKN